VAVTYTGAVGRWALIGSLLFASLASMAACGTAFILVLAPALQAVIRASVAAERAAARAEKAMEEFEKLSVQTLDELPRALAEVEAAGKEWNELGGELRELLQRVERW
jgi:hydroxyethylthiazole kinase-like sugar kinase family protein